MKYILILDGRSYRVDAISTFYTLGKQVWIRCGGETYCSETERPHVVAAALQYMMVGEAYPEFCEAIRGRESKRGNNCLVDFDKELT